jgi:hypothetical protein
VAAALFTEDEITQFLSVPKWVPYEDWHDPNRPLRSPMPGEQTKVPVKAKSPDVGEEISFVIDRAIVARRTSHQYHITLSVQVKRITPVPICRYDLQVAQHSNKSCCSDQLLVVRTRQPHRHVYCPKCAEAIDAWDACAELLDPAWDSLPKLIGGFMKDLNVHTESTEAHNDLFDQKP